MKNITFNQLHDANFTLYENNPIIKNPINSFVVADPSVLTPDSSPDGKWHLFCHTFYGINHYSGDDGINFRKVRKVVSDAQRPHIDYADGEYYLCYEKTRSTLMRLFSLFGAKWKSEIYCTTSPDLKKWSKPKRVLAKTREFEEDERGVAISNPFLLSTKDGYRLYYSCGQTFIKDCGFCEPTHISFAESKAPDSGYISRTKPIISPDKNSSYLNLCSGCIKVYELKDCYIGLQNGIYESEGKSHSAIMLLKSSDGIDFEFVKPLIVPQICSQSNWMAQYVYACSLVKYNNELRIYFNARNVSDTLKGRECIGFIKAELNK